MQFWVFRISINANEAASLYSQGLDNASRYEALRTAIMNPRPALYRNVTYSFYNVDRVDDSVVGRISHPDEIDRTVEEAPNVLKDIREESNAWAHFLFTGQGEQVFLVQKKQEFFAGDADGLAEIIKRVIKASLRDERLLVEVRPIKREGDFWEILSRIARLHRVDFEFVAPNMFGGRKPLAELLDLQRRMHNATFFDQESRVRPVIYTTSGPARRRQKLTMPMLVVDHGESQAKIKMGAK